MAIPTSSLGGVAVERPAGGCAFREVSGVAQLGVSVFAFLAADVRPASMPRVEPVVIIRIHGEGQSNLFEIAAAPGGLAFFLALASAGSNMAARMAIMAMTTSSSISVNAL